MFITFLAEKDALDKDDVNVPKCISKAIKVIRGFLNEINGDIYSAVAPQRQDELLKRLMEPQRMIIKMPTRVAIAKTHTRQVKPAVDRDQCHAHSCRLKRSSKSLRSKALSTRVNAGNADEHRALDRHFTLSIKYLLFDLPKVHQYVLLTIGRTPAILSLIL